MRLVIIESPYAGDVAANVAYAERALMDCLKRGEAPIASHLLFPGRLDDNDPEQRRLGMEAGLAWYRVAEACVVYCDRDTSNGMIQGVERAKAWHVPVEYRIIGLWDKNGSP